MPFYADLHIHSKYSRACSKDCDLEHLSWWAGRKGISVVGTGDFVHPAWSEELADKLIPAEPGLFRLRPEAEREIARTLPGPCRNPVRFMLTVEISTIYKRDDRTRKVHHLLYAPTLEAAGRIQSALGKIGNITSDGRPILGLDSRDLLEITLESDPGSYLIPAHAWTPWFSVLGSKSGFDAVADCYADLADHIFAVETGLSSDPPMNWMVSSLDRYALVSNSDAHSPPALGREASSFDTDVDYFAIRRALETREGYAGSVEFFPEEGKYHLDGHRKCGVRLEPGETRSLGGRCPECGRPLTVGVLSRVEELADRAEGYRPENAAGFTNLVQLPEIVSEILGVGPKSKKVVGRVGELVAELGPEMSILTDVPPEDVTRAGGTRLGEAIGRLRRGEVVREGGYDGEYGVIRLFAPGESALEGATEELFDSAVFAAAPIPRPRAVAKRTAEAPVTRVDADGDGSSGTGGDNRLGRGRGDRPGTGKGDRPGTGGSDRLGTGEGDRVAADRGDLVAAGGGDIAADEDALLRDTFFLDDAGGQFGAGEPEPESVPGPRGGDDDAPGRDLASIMVPGQMAIDVPPEAAEPTGSLLDGLDPDQRAAAEATGSPLLIVAGPGTGKTRTLTHRLAHLIRGRGVPPEHCLAITFTRRAREEMAERLAALAPEQAPRVTVTTFHGLGALILREQYARAGLSARFRIADEAERLEVAAQVAGSEQDGRRLLASMNRLFPEATTAEAGAELWQRYAKELRARDLADFTDLLHLPVRILADDPALVRHYRSRWRCISVDEYQDVDEVQYALLRQLTGPDGDITAIGDPDQAIYRFRGADVGFFLRFTRDFQNARTVQLTRNYRSTPAIVHGAVRAIAPSSLVPERVLTPCGSRETAKIGVHEAADERAEAEFVTRTIDRLLGGTSHHSLDSGQVTDDGTEGLSFSDIAVLYRTDSQAAVVAAALTRAGVPFQKRSHDRLAARPGMRLLTDELAHHGEEALTDRVKASARHVIATLPEDDEQVADVRAAAELLLPLAERCGGDLERLLSELALGAEVDALDPRADRVALLTLHASKGLEFPVTFLVGCESGLLPLRLPGETPDPDAIEEERRLFFVGMTRAQRRLYLSYARKRTRYGAERETGGSPFLRPLTPEVSEPVDVEATRKKPKDRQLRLI
ncbi:MAG: AAA family ATPase [Streptosporangiales bacterium]|nr:AAA family ATPase [Streptosporangiales bacterium]